MTGYIFIYRKIIENPIYRKANYFRVWMDILLHVNHKDNSFIFNNQKITIKKGSGIFSQLEMSKRLKISTGSLNLILKYLKAESMIETKTTNKYTEISVKKWDTYQKPESKYESKVKTNREQSETNNNDKNVKNVKNTLFIAKRKYSHIKELNEGDFLEIAEYYKVPIAFIRSKYDDMVLWAGSKPNNPKLRGRNWRLTLMRFVKDDLVKMAERRSNVKYRAVDARNIK